MLYAVFFVPEWDVDIADVNISVKYKTWSMFHSFRCLSPVRVKLAKLKSTDWTGCSSILSQPIIIEKNPVTA